MANVDHWREAFRSVASLLLEYKKNAYHKLQTLHWWEFRMKYSLQGTIALCDTLIDVISGLYTGMVKYDRNEEGDGSNGMGN